jgi:formylglycine-generating enzyme required for sulfatase activity
MGCPPDDPEGYDNERPRHLVKITTGFWLGQTPVTQAAYEKVMGENPSHFKNPKLPVETVDWEEARRYCELVEGRLPTEAEWEYAARAGGVGARYGKVDKIAWTRANSDGGLARWDNYSRISGISTICSGMCGNGLRTGIKRTTK